MTRSCAEAGPGLRVLVTGASGFVGRALVRRLRLHLCRRGAGETVAGPDHYADRLAGSGLAARAVDRLTLLDLDIAAGTLDEGVRVCRGSIADPAVVADAFAPGIDLVFHLASVPGGLAEQHHELARDVNLFGTLHLLEQGRAQVLRGGPAPVFVFASTIAVYGSPLPPRVDDDTPAAPQMSYGAHKLAGEILVADFSRRGWVDGRSLRLAGVLARPPAPTGQLSAFMSDMIRALRAGRSYTCPVGPQATTWASSIGSVVDNLLHAAALEARQLPRRTLTLPSLQFSFGELAEAIGRMRGEAAAPQVTWAPDERLETLFGRFPPLHTAAADAAGFRHDGSLDQLVRRALAEDESQATAMAMAVQAGPA